MSYKAIEIFFKCYGESKQRDWLITLSVHLVKVANSNIINPLNFKSYEYLFSFESVCR